MKRRLTDMNKNKLGYKCNPSNITSRHSVTQKLRQKTSTTSYLEGETTMRNTRIKEHVDANTNTAHTKKAGL